ncbi:MAG: hypothetical protein JWN72_921 [Thermoleophilia bacterium]|nr:hypothetical protein [Thermoleophilia bacterium]
MHMLTTLTHRFHQLRTHPDREAGTSVVEYVGLGAVGAMLVSGVAAALDGHAGDRIATAIVKRIIEVISN